MRRVVFVNRYFHPDHSATSQIASGLAFHLASSGWEVSVVTGRQRYDDPHAQLPRRETAGGVRIERIWSTRFGRGGLAGRAVDYATFFLSATVALLRERGATVVAMTDPPLISVVAALVSNRVVNWLQDLFPEIASALGVRVPGHLRFIRDWSLQRAAANVVLGERMASRVPRAVVIHNWADRDLRPLPAEGNPFRRALDLDGAFVIGYSGNFGRAHEFETIARATRLLEPADSPVAPRIRFLFIGDGAKLDSVKRAAGRNVVFLPYQPREVLSQSLSAADVHLVTLQPSLEGLVVPSKFYGALAVGRPVIFIGSRDGELANLVREGECGRVIDAGDSEGLVAAIREMSVDPAGTAAMGRRALELYRERFSPEIAFAAWENTLRVAG